jgi:methanogenic corrinoid protein MtbC1
MSEVNLIKEFENAVISQEPAILEKAFQKASSSTLSTDLILKAMTTGLDAVRMRLNDHSISIPEFLLSVDILKQGLDKLNTLPSAKKVPKKTGPIVIGVVEGDIHELGKNIIANVLEVSGYTVIDMGKNVPANDFIEKVKESRASLLALSTMMSTPLENMKETVARCKREMPQVPVMVGGATLDETIARSYGADGYAESVVTVTKEVQRLLG